MKTRNKKTARVVSVKLPPELARALDAKAGEVGESASVVARLCIRMGLPKVMEALNGNVGAEEAA